MSVVTIGGSNAKLAIPGGVVVVPGEATPGGAGILLLIGGAPGGAVELLTPGCAVVPGATTGTPLFVGFAVPGVPAGATLAGGGAGATRLNSIAFAVPIESAR